MWLPRALRFVQQLWKTSLLHESRGDGKTQLHAPKCSESLQWNAPTSGNGLLLEPAPGRFEQKPTSAL